MDLLFQMMKTGTYVYTIKDPAEVKNDLRDSQEYPHKQEFCANIRRELMNDEKILRSAKKNLLVLYYNRIIFVLGENIL